MNLRILIGISVVIIIVAFVFVFKSVTGGTQLDFDVPSAKPEGPSDSGVLKESVQGAPSWWDEKLYLEVNPDVANAVTDGTFSSGYDHWVRAGRSEDRKGVSPR